MSRNEISQAVLTPPEDAYQAIDQAAEEAGGAYEPPAEFQGSIGSTMFDLPSSKDGTVTVLLARENIDAVPSQALVRIKSRGDDRVYLGAVVEGPFAEPDGLRADSTPMVVTAVKGSLLLPKFHGRVQVELIGERLASGTVIPPRRRPKPNSPVFTLDAKETAEVLGIQGNLRFGLAEGFENLPVCVESNSKGLFPRHFGILGTTGGGKSTTVSGLIGKLQEQKAAVILIDTEGEYCTLHEPTDDKRMLEALKRRALKAGGVANTSIVHLTGRDTANPKHPDVTTFSLQFSSLSPYAVQEILDLSEAQSVRFFKAFDVTKLAMEKLGIWPKDDAGRQFAMDVDEMDSGHPNMTLNMLYDVIAEIAAVIEDAGAEPNLDTNRASLGEFGVSRSSTRLLPNLWTLSKC
jgi:hypothetical protein